MACPDRRSLSGQARSYLFCLKVQFIPKLKPEKIKYQKKITRKVTMFGADSYRPETKWSGGWKKKLHQGKRQHVWRLKPQRNRGRRELGRKGRQG